VELAHDKSKVVMQLFCLFLAVLCVAVCIIYSYFKTILEFLAEEVINDTYSTAPASIDAF
jgi:hypothetical protein